MSLVFYLFILYFDGFGGTCYPNGTCGVWKVVMWYGMSCTNVNDCWEFVMIDMPASVHKGPIVR